MSTDTPTNTLPDPSAKAAPEAPVLERRDEQGGAKFKRSIYALPVTVDVIVGSARPTVTELLGFDEGSLLALDRGVEDPVDLCVDGRVIARGELVEMEDGAGIGVRITQVVDVAEDALG
ncbi:hypothetical protein GCM10009069_10750 [Algimonas arctica]|uniref:Flagellar motor switch protein FliN n=1 Tax=Algimonas arctica TaxID=1479486 RepID=A0A8J3CR81_9PROT|nr:FliM/FliN family flagellar motor switch protein [Algimonas arctica]GHA89479.1 hypothetical protein GCM10009069_10750 [Algimonas arctica]